MTASPRRSSEKCRFLANDKPLPVEVEQLCSTLLVIKARIELIPKLLGAGLAWEDFMPTKLHGIAQRKDE
jgi:hypothetical protein